MKIISVIVPVYNVEKYLEKCLESLVNQTMTDLEIIVVNDGATDNSGVIIEKFAKKYQQIISLKKENGGLSDARNYGMKYATGEYIGFIDSDDFVDLDMYEKMYRKAKEEDSDIVECNLHHTYSDHEDTEIGKKIFDKKEMLMKGRSVVWNKIYKRDWLMKTDVTFSKGLIYEDVEFYLKLIPYIKQYSYIDEAMVHYVQRQNSINNISSKKTLDIIEILSHILIFYKEKGFYTEYREALEFFYTRILLCSSFSRMCKIADKEERVETLRRNYSCLEENFPSWKNNCYLKAEKTKIGFFMKTVNRMTYWLYASMFHQVYQLQKGF